MNRPLRPRLSSRAGMELADDVTLLPPDPRASLDRTLRLVWRWRGTFLDTFSIMCGLGVAYLAYAPKQYTASATLMVGFRKPELVSADRAPPFGGPDVDGAIEVMKLPTILQEVSKQLDLASHPSFRRVIEGPAAARPDEAIAFYLGKKLSIERIGHSNFVSVTYTSVDPNVAAAVVNQVATDSAGEHVLRQLSLAERTEFEVPKITVVSAADVPFEPSWPKTVVWLAVTLTAALSVAGTTILLRDYYAMQRMHHDPVGTRFDKAA